MSDMPNRIREHRRARKETLRVVADRIGCGEVMLSAMERGDRRLSTYWMERLATALEVAPSDLLNSHDNDLGLAIEERELVIRYRSADPETRAKIRAMVALMAPEQPRAMGSRAA